MNFSLIRIFLILVAIGNFELFAQKLPLKIDRFRLEDGHPGSPIAGQVIQDEDGFIWFGTWNGLYKYDGYKFTGYHHDPNDSLSVAHDWCFPYIDKQGNFWVGTVAGLDQFDPDHGTFKHFRHNPKDSNTIGKGSLTAIFEDKHGNLWIGKEDGLDYFNLSTKQFTHYEYDPNDDSSLFGNQVRTIYEDKQGIIWVGTGNPFSHEMVGGLNRFDPIANTFQHFLIAPDEPMSTKNHVQAIYQHPDGTIWIGGWQGGLYSFDLKAQKFVTLPYLNYPQSKSRQNFHGITSIIAQSGTDYLWMSTFGGGISRYNMRTLQSEYSTFETGNPYSLRDDRVWNIFIDRNNNLWVGTHAGLNKANLPGKFPQYTLSLSRNEGVTDIYEDNNGILWLGTSHMRLIRWDRKKNTYTSYQPPINNCLKWNVPGTAITGKEHGNLWVATTCGLFEFNVATNQFIKSSLPINASHDLTCDQPLRILIDSHNVMWLSFHSPVAISLSTRQMQRYYYVEGDSSSLNNNDVDVIFEDRDKTIWIGTANGLARFNRLTNSFTQMLVITDEQKASVTDILQEEDGFLSVSTDTYGVIRINPETGEKETFSIKNGIHSNSLFNIFSDDVGHYWLSAPTGISHFDRHNNSVAFFDQSDGLVEMTFANRSNYQTSDGKIVLGGFGAVNIFNPKDYVGRKNPSPLLVTGIRIDNKLLKQGENSPLIQPIVRTKEIILSHDQNNLTFEYVAINYRNTSQNQYQYMLDNFDNDWVSAGHGRSASYSKLPPGTYFFRVKSVDGEGIWSEGSPIRITILDPWWKTVWAYIVYGLLISSILYLLWKYESRRLYLRNQLQFEKLEADRLKEMNRMKSQFFTNISHEFRTPLTVISGQLEEAISKSEPTPRGLKDAHTNSVKLVKLVNEILTLAKLESGTYTLQKKQADFLPFLKSQFFSYESYAHQRDITIRYKSDVQRAFGEYDIEKMEIIISNLMSNAIKFSPESGTIDMAVTAEAEDMLVIRITDQGPGIPVKEHAKVFERFYQVEGGQLTGIEGTGIGLALTKELVILHGGEISFESEPGNGSTFIIRLKSYEIEVGTMVIEEGITMMDAESKMPDDDNAETSIGQPIILLVEDNQDVRYYLKQCLEQNYHIYEAANGKAALLLADEVIPDLIITDVMMPEMDGYSLTLRLKESEKTSHVPIIMLTARANRDDKLQGLATGVDDFLIKPFNKKELLLRINNLLSIRKQLREKFSTNNIIIPSELDVTSVDQSFLNKIINHIEQHMDDYQLNVESLALTVSMSDSQLNRKLNSLIGQSPGKLIRSMRLQRGAELIGKKAGSISEIAYKCGFNDLTSFTRGFKREFGVSPSQFQARK